ncbi:MAG: carbon-nitrogen hydrolase family protein [Rhodospirillaceae bacterium]|nr:carbon-nitrogen hydrolase family protein [Rhodospirillaceae bacterium]MDD9997817.1 carbon-nitrogen hydrolase family protein [Rhodospirillaceae bacterium]MDE0363868.1 carbon-nitrogen hydrolase family protein [Rhodospirillaceae bacterium]
MSNRTIRVAVLQELAMPGSGVQPKVERSLALIEQASRDGAQIIMGGELCTTDYVRVYGEKDNDIFLDAEPIPGPSTAAVGELTKQYGNYVIFPIFEQGAPGIYYNSAPIIGPSGDVVGNYRKTQVAGVQALEKMYFRAGQDFKVLETDFEPNAKFGVIVCHDRRYPETARINAILGAEMLFCPTAAPGYAHGVHWDNLNVMRAVDNGLFAIYSNRVGPEEQNSYFGESMIVNPMGEVIAKLGQEENAVLIADCDLDLVDKARISVPTLRDMRGEFWMKYYSPSYDQLI